MNIDLTGRVVWISNKQMVGKKEEHPKIEFAVEHQDGNYTQFTCLSVFGDTPVESFERAGIEQGDTVEVTFSLRGREHNGRYFNDLSAWRFSKVDQHSAMSTAGNEEDSPF